MLCRLLGDQNAGIGNRCFEKCATVQRFGKDYKKLKPDSGGN
jgi:hypothetical protein